MHKCRWDALSRCVRVLWRVMSHIICCLCVRWRRGICLQRRLHRRRRLQNNSRVKCRCVGRLKQSSFEIVWESVGKLDRKGLMCYYVTEGNRRERTGEGQLLCRCWLDSICMHFLIKGIKCLKVVRGMKTNIQCKRSWKNIDWYASVILYKNNVNTKYYLYGSDEKSNQNLKR